MSGKRVEIPVKPVRLQNPEADTWVESRNAPQPAPPQQDRAVARPTLSPPTVEMKEAIKRLTIDIPESLHRDIKAQCAMRGTKIADEVRELLMKKYRSRQD